MGKAGLLGPEELKGLFKSGLECLRAHEKEIDELNVFPVPDGDTGTNMTMTLAGGVSATEGKSFEGVFEYMKAFSRGTLLGARGNSGVILSQFIKGLSGGMEGKDEIGLKDFSAAFAVGTQKAYESVIKPTEGTILTAMKDAGEHLESIVSEKEDADIEEAFSSLCEVVKKTVEHTPELLPVLKEAGVVDSGAAGFLYILTGMSDKLCGKDAGYDLLPEDKARPAADLSAFNADSQLEFGYCTEFILQLLHSKTDIASFDKEAFVKFLESIGDSIVMVHDEDVVKVHVHTFEPGKILEHAQKFGEFLTVKIENMSLQHNETLLKKEEKPTIKKETAVVAALSGKGLKEYFSEIGADIIVEGGASANPSTDDFIEAFKQIEAEHILVLPCNSNVVMAAEQAADMYKDSDVRVIRAKTIAEGYAALSMMNLTLDIESAIRAMEQAVDETQTALVAKASRDAEYDGLKVTKGHYIGLNKDEVLSDSEDIVEAARELLKKTKGIEDKVVLVGFYGSSADESDIRRIEEMIKEEFSYLEYGFIDGGQEVYDLIFAVE